MPQGTVDIDVDVDVNVGVGVGVGVNLDEDEYVYIYVDVDVYVDVERSMLFSIPCNRSEASGTWGCRSYRWIGEWSCFGHLVS